MNTSLSQSEIAVVVVVAFAIGLVLFVSWLWGLVRLFTGNHTALGVIGIFIAVVAWSGFFLSPKPGSSRYDRQVHKRHKDWEPHQTVPIISQRPQPTLGQISGGPAILVVSGERGSEVNFDLPRGSMVVGRSAEADITLGDDSVSNLHAILTTDGDHLRINDLRSTNGTVVNGTPVGDGVDLHDGDEIRFGAATSYVRMPGHGNHALPDPTPRFMTPSTNGSPQRSVFISYASEDEATVQTISRHLQTDGWEVWFDQHDLQPGEQWGRRIADAIARTSVVLAVVSPATLQSQWVDAELQLARNNDRPILGLIIERTDPQAIQQRLGLYLGRQRMDLSEIGGRIGGPELQEVSLTLDALAREGSVRPPVPAAQRTGTAVLLLGLAGLAASVSWFVAKFLATAGSMGEFFRTLTNSEANSEASFDNASAAFQQTAETLLSSFYVMPAMIGAIALIAVGIALRRSARRKALKGR